MALLDKIEIITSSINTVKEKLGLDITSSLEEVVEAAGNGGGNEGIYLVASEAEMNAISEPKEEDIAVVYVNGPAQTTVTRDIPGVWYFPQTIVLPEGEQSASVALGANVLTTTAKITLTPTLCTITKGTSTVVAEYSSEDGITYTRTTEADTYDFGVTKMSPRSGQTLNSSSPLLFFIYTHTFYFMLYQYMNNTWDNMVIGCDPDLSEILTSTTVFTDHGFKKGTRKATDYRTNYIYMQSSEPAEKTGLWITPASGSYAISDVPINTYFTSKPVENFNKSTRIGDVGAWTVNSSGSSSSLEQDWLCTAWMRGVGLSTEFNHNGIRVGDKLYFFPYPTTQSAASGLKVHSMDLDGTNVTALSCPYGPTYFNTKVMLNSINNGTKIVYVAKNSSNVYYIMMYDIATNTWTYTTYGKSSFESALGVTDFSTYNWFRINDYIFYISSSEKRCFRISGELVATTPTDVTELTLSDQAYEDFKNKSSDYFVDSRNRLWYGGLCYNPETLERLSPENEKIRMSYAQGFYEKDNILYIIGMDVDGVTVVSYDLDTMHYLTRGLANIFPASLPSYGEGTYYPYPVYSWQMVEGNKLVWFAGYYYSADGKWTNKDRYEIEFEQIEFLDADDYIVIHTGENSQLKYQISQNIWTTIADVSYIRSGDEQYYTPGAIYVGNGVEWRQIK